MKNLLLTVFAVFTISFGYSQGLENVIVEPYYITEANDTNANSLGGVLPVGSVTYRVYIDLQPGWRLQSVYGDANHECRIATTTLFFNNEDRGATTANGINFNYMDDNTVMLDSWVSVGAAANNKMGIQKSQDDGISTVVNNDGVLQGTNPSAGIPLTQEDGFFTGTPEPVTLVGINNEIEVFNNQNDGTNGPVFSTFNGAWASLNGSIGPDPALNEVLVAQITTDGTLTFSLNVQIRQDSTFVVENYVAANPQGSEILFPALNFNSLTIGIDENIASEIEFNVFPNPAKDYLTLKLGETTGNSSLQYSIYGVTGNLVKSNTLSGNTANSSHLINISGIEPGYYFIKVAGNGSTSTRTFVKF